MYYSTHKFDDAVRLHRMNADAATDSAVVTPAPGSVETAATVTPSPVSNEPTPLPTGPGKTLTGALPPPPPLPLVQPEVAPSLPRPATINFIVPPTYSTNLPTSPTELADTGSKSSGGGGGGGGSSDAGQAVAAVKKGGKGIFWVLLLAAAGTGIYAYNK